MTKSKPFVKNLKIINRSINSLLERNLNKLKFDNLKILASNNKIILTFVALFIIFISYLLLPTFYKQGDISKELKNKLLSKFNLDFTFNQNLEYNFFPRPHFTSKDSHIIENQNKIAEISQIKINISFDNLFSIKNLDIKEVILNNTNFELNNKNFNFFFKIFSLKISLRKPLLSSNLLPVKMYNPLNFVELFFIFLKILLNILSNHNFHKTL